MNTKRNKNHNRYRTMRSAILTSSLLSILPLVVLMKGAAGTSAGSAVPATSAQAVAAAPGTTQTTTAQKAVPSPVTYTRTKAS